MESSTTTTGSDFATWQKQASRWCYQSLNVVKPVFPAVIAVARKPIWSEANDLPVDLCTGKTAANRAKEVFLHAYRAYPTVSSPEYELSVA